MPHKSKVTVMEPGLLASLARWRPALKSGWHRPASLFSVERLEDRTLMSHGLGGGPDLRSGPQPAGDLSELPQPAPITILPTGDDLTDDRGGGGPDRRGGGPPVLQPSGSEVSPSSGSPGGPTGVVTIGNTGSQGTSGGPANGSGSTGGGGPGYPIIPGSGPALHGDSTAQREPIPVLLPGREPALAVIPTVPKDLGSTTGSPAQLSTLVPVAPDPPTGPASAATLVALDPTTEAGVGALALIAASAPSTAPLASNPTAGPSSASIAQPAVPASTVALVALDPTTGAGAVSLAAPVASVPATMPGSAPINEETAPSAVIPSAVPAALVIQSSSASETVVPRVFPTPTPDAMILSGLAMNATSGTGTTSTEPVATAPPQGSTPEMSPLGVNVPSSVSDTATAISPLARATSEPLSASSIAPSGGSVGPSAGSSRAAVVNPAPTPSASNAIVISMPGALRKPSEAGAPAGSPSPDVVRAASEPENGPVPAFPGGPAPKLHPGPFTLNEGTVSQQTAPSPVTDRVVPVQSDSLGGPTFPARVQVDDQPSHDQQQLPGSPPVDDPAGSTAVPARGWEEAGDWLADLATIEAGEETELARCLAPVLFAAGACLAWGNLYHSTRTIPRERLLAE